MSIQATATVAAPTASPGGTQDAGCAIDNLGNETIIVQMTLGPGMSVGVFEVVAA